MISVCRLPFLQPAKTAAELPEKNDADKLPQGGGNAKRATFKLLEQNPGKKVKNREKGASGVHKN